MLKPVRACLQGVATSFPTKSGGVGSAFDFDFYDLTISKYVKKKPVGLPLRKMMGWYESGVLEEANVIESTQHLHRELPLRLARTLRSFETLPLIVLNQRGMLTAFKDYHSSFNFLAASAVPTTLEEALAYSDGVDQVMKANSGLLNSLSEGVNNAKRVMTPSESDRLDAFVHMFIQHRLSRRLLAANHAALIDHFKLDTPPTNEVGAFYLRAPIKTIVEAAADEAQDLCGSEYGQYPVFDVKMSEPNIELFCIPANLQAILVEILKNSMKATVERHGEALELPRVKCEVAKTIDGVVYILLEDRGGGMSESSEASLWRYGVSGHTILDKHGDVTSAKKKAAADSAFGVRDIHTQRLSGYGFGLPLSKARANYFGGNLWIRNMEGYGVDTFIRMIPSCQRWS